ncbi:two component transcriptional regulator, LytTR family [Chitinophaga jiangningensis]|uniref:Two component transcriptional regulator, LytTR family n=1 Tax=Chitinophaga jiangningensis TaxID=1419482 RepID=A0A1M7C4R3_9BACT|nr:LytTR family DNA-binding domain-containing protein [Chitinophaga jiangningensis]SHL62200.1 two component transcriptional regulator, LytTR family [Chitinophaga jiangningensis]
MRIVIIEDEIKAAKSLAGLIAKIRPEATVETMLHSIESAVAYLNTNPPPDLLFMDVQLSDGLCFEIFRQVKITSPVIFCTAYGEYSMDAIKSNGVDYILKPFSASELEAAFTKMDNFRNFFQQREQSDWLELIRRLDKPESKTSFLIFHNNRYMTVRTEQIAFIYIKYDAPYIVTFQQQKYIISQTLEQLQAQLSPRQFYRLNRQYLINFDAIKEVEHYSGRKLAIHLAVPAEEQLTVGKDKMTQFLQWMENR